MRAILVLEDGRSFLGESGGVKGERVAEVIMNTAVVGYQEILTDPANADKILVLTYPLIGNYGCAPKFNESGKVWLAGLVIKENSRIFSNWQAKEGLGSFIKDSGLVSLRSADTRTLAVHLRQKGPMYGIISTQNFEVKELLSKISSFRKEKPAGALERVSVKQGRRLGKPSGKKIVVLDLGVTNSIVRQLESLGFSLRLLPYNASAEEIMGVKPKGMVIAGGPEDITRLEEVADNLKPVIGKIPILGISSGNLALGMALGAKAVKLRTGHRGVNYPVQSPASFKGEITVQNHGYALDPASLLKVKGLKIEGYNLNDRTVEEFAGKKIKAFGVQYIPASPGFNEAHPVFARFKKMLGRD